MDGLLLLLLLPLGIVRMKGGVMTRDDDGFRMRDDVMRLSDDDGMKVIVIGDKEE